MIIYRIAYCSKDEESSSKPRRKIPDYVNALTRPIQDYPELRAISGPEFQKRPTVKFPTQQNGRALAQWQMLHLFTNDSLKSIPTGFYPG